MRKVVLASAVWNASLGAFLLLPAVYRPFGLRVPHPFWGWALCAFIWYTAAVLVIACRDLPRRASLVYWEAILRFVAAALLFTVGAGVIGWIAWFVGATDILWGLAYTFGLPRALNTTHAALLLDADTTGRPA
jgi:hypothetical protein